MKNILKLLPMQVNKLILNKELEFDIKGIDLETLTKSLKEFQKLLLIAKEDVTGSLDLEIIKNNLEKIASSIKEDPELAKVRGKLSEAGKKFKVNSTKHQELVSRYNELKKSDNYVLFSLVQEIKRQIANQTPKPSSGETIIEHELTNMENCITVQCPILFDEDYGCILIKNFENLPTNNKLLKNNPVAFGNVIKGLITPMIFSYEIAEGLSQRSQVHPLTRDPICGFIPLSRDANVMVCHLSNLFGYKAKEKELLLSYISAITLLFESEEWIDKQIFGDQILCLLNDDTLNLKTYIKNKLSLLEKTYVKIEDTAIIKIAETFLKDSCAKELSKEFKIPKWAPKIISGDLIDLAKKGEFDVIVHLCNCFHKMSAGLSLAIMTEFPNIVTKDRQTVYGNSKLGTVSYACHNDLFIVNAYCITDFKRRYLGHELFDYNAFRRCMQQINRQFASMKIGLPKFGSGLTRGNWTTIFNIIKEELKNIDVTIVVFK